MLGRCKLIRLILLRFFNCVSWVYAYLLRLVWHVVGYDSSVVKVINYGLGKGGSIPVRNIVFSIRHHIQSACGGPWNLLSYPVFTQDLFLRGKTAEAVTLPLPASGSEVKNAWIFNSVHPSMLSWRGT